MEQLKGRIATWMKYVEYGKPRVKTEVKFLGFGVGYEEFEVGAGNFSTAIIMLDDGTINSVPVDDVRFDADVYQLIVTDTPPPAEEESE